jgi:thioredoxin 1
MSHSVDMSSKLSALIADVSRDRFVLLVFSGQWCVPCKKLYGALKKWSSNYRDEIHVVIVDADKHAAVFQAYGIHGIPTIKVIRHNHVLLTQAGLTSKGHLKKLLKNSHEAWKHIQAG